MKNNFRKFSPFVKTELEKQDIDAIASRVLEMVEPLLIDSKKHNGNETILDQGELAAYLKVSRSWVDQRISSQEIHYFKCGKYPRFRKTEIDRWMNKNTVQAVPKLSMVRKRKHRRQPLDVLN